MRIAIIEERLRGILAQLVGAHTGGAGMSKATKGRERELVIDLFLRQCLPPHFRFGSGEIIDGQATRTGQLDIVVELPFAPSLPMLGTDLCRLYFAEGVGAVIEVKSDLQAGWDKAQATLASVASLKMECALSTGSLDGSIGKKDGIACFAVGFEGWSEQTKLVEKARGGGVGILQLDPAIFVWPGNRAIVETGPAALGAMLCALSESVLVHKDRFTVPYKTYIAQS